MQLCNVIHTMTYFMAYLLYIFSRQENQSHRVNHAAVPDEDLCWLNLRREIMVRHRVREGGGGVICLPTKHLGVLKNSFKRVCAFQNELKFGSVGAWGEGKTRWTGQKPLRVKERTNNKLNPHMGSTPGFGPRPHYWKASAFTTAPSCLKTICC